MHVLVIGAAGMIGRKLTAELVKPGTLKAGAVTKFTLADVVEPSKLDGFSGRSRRLPPTSRRRAQRPRWSQSGRT